MIEITTKGKLPEIKREPLFSIDGVEYTAPTEYRVNESLMFIGLIRKKGFSLALDWAMSTALGDGYTALLECEHVTPEQIDEIGTTVVTKLMGNLDGPKASSTAG